MYGTVASRFNDDGVTALYQFLTAARWRVTVCQLVAGQLPAVSGRTSTKGQAIVPPGRDRYLADIAATVRAYHRSTDEQAAAARRRQQLGDVAKLLAADGRRGAAAEVEEVAAARAPSAAS